MREEDFEFEQTRPRNPNNALVSALFGDGYALMSATVAFYAAFDLAPTFRLMRVFLPVEAPALLQNAVAGILSGFFSLIEVSTPEILDELWDRGVESLRWALFGVYALDYITDVAELQRNVEQRREYVEHLLHGLPLELMGTTVTPAMVDWAMVIVTMFISALASFVALYHIVHVVERLQEVKHTRPAAYYRALTIMVASALLGVLVWVIG